MVEQQLTTERRQRWPRRRTDRLQRWRHIGQLAVLHPGRNSELTQASVHKRDLLHRPGHLERDVAELPLQHRVTHIVPCLPGQHQRQIAVNLRAIGPTQRALHVNDAGHRHGPGGIGRAPGDLGAALRIGVGKLQVAQLHLRFHTVMRPLHVC